MGTDPDELPVACGREAAGLLGRLLGDELVAVWLTGSGALGGVAPGLSDVDVAAVTATDLPEDRRRALAAALAELAMTWPLRGIEFVLYARGALATPERRPRFAINLNVGPRMPYRLSLDPATEPAHWFLLDLAILRDHGRVLNASRGWRFAAEGVWSSKRDAGAWAMARTRDPATVETALAIRYGDDSRPLDPARVERFQAEALAAVEEALRDRPPG
jgi:hypothetical protein